MNKIKKILTLSIIMGFGLSTSVFSGHCEDVWYDCIDSDPYGSIEEFELSIAYQLGCANFYQACSQQ